MAEKTNITRDAPPDATSANIESTREAMSGTAEEIEGRLSGRHGGGKFREGALGRLKSAASGMGGKASHAGSSIMSTIKSNQMPLALMGIGIGWLLYNRTRDGSAETGSFEKRGGALKEKAGEISASVQSKAGEMTGQIREKSSIFAGKAKDSATRYGKAARNRARGAGTWFQQMMHGNPLAAVLAAFTAGSAVGFLIPESGREREMMGASSGNLLEKVKETAQQTMQKAQQAAEKAVQTAEQEFKQAKSA